MDLSISARHYQTYSGGGAGTLTTYFQPVFQRLQVGGKYVLANSSMTGANYGWLQTAVTTDGNGIPSDAFPPNLIFFVDIDPTTLQAQFNNTVSGYGGTFVANAPGVYFPVVGNNYSWAISSGGIGVACLSAYVSPINYVAFNSFSSNFFSQFRDRILFCAQIGSGRSHYSVAAGVAERGSRADYSVTPFPFPNRKFSVQSGYLCCLPIYSPTRNLFYSVTDGTYVVFEFGLSGEIITEAEFFADRPTYPVASPAQLNQPPATIAQPTISAGFDPSFPEISKDFLAGGGGF